MKGVHRQATEAFPVVEISKTLDFSSEGSLNCFEFNTFTLHVRSPQRTAVFQMRSYVGFVQEHHGRYIPGDEGVSIFTELRVPHRRSVSISIMDCICIYIHLFIY